MSQKPDFYTILGVEKTASEADIKKAFMRITMTCHPDSAPYKKLEGAQKAEADMKFMYGKEAQAVLLDPVKRATYDKLGHAGLDAANNGGNGQSASWTENMAPVKKRVRTQEETFDYFDRAAVRNGDTPAAPKTSGNESGLSEEEMRAAARAARRRARGQDAETESFTPPAAEVPPPATKAEVKTETPASKPPAAAEKPPSSGASAVFDTVAGKMAEAASRLRDAAKADAELPVAALEKFRGNLQDLIGEVDTAIHNARKNGPKGGYNR